MGRGRKPKPTKLKLLAGNPGRRPLNDNEPEYEQVARMPAWLSDAARAEWRRIVPGLAKLGLATIADREALAAYCEACSRLKEATKQIKKYGLIVDGATGGLVKNPAVDVANTATSAIIRLAAEFGFTPAGRTKVHAKKPEKLTDLERFMKGG